MKKMTEMRTAAGTQQLRSASAVGMQRPKLYAAFNVQPKRRKAAARIKLFRGFKQCVAASCATVNAVIVVIKNNFSFVHLNQAALQNGAALRSRV